MFGLFKPKLAPEGPVEFSADVEIGKPAGEVYALIDWADDRNAKRATGNMVRQIPATPDRFEMVMEFMNDLTFEFAVTEAEPHRVYAFDCVIRPQVGNMKHNHERYEFEQLGPDKCRVTVTTKTTFVEGLRMRDFTCEVATIAASVQSSLQKLKLQAELGPEVAKALEENTVL
ncbi:hypothetical protein [Erythrobacter sp. JK5]|uniref:hypothetical protein n=1 Tax=Erythrobacter sp. JK5 TaxID=2829500 RepID=UPI001BAC2F33|nr:hypothetical protein [Erythrobacter sp. JK5]QUL38237.1 hypothetical protein KDC96_02105 [Erythrobacter sp. JK5]